MLLLCYHDRLPCPVTQFSGSSVYKGKFQDLLRPQIPNLRSRNPLHTNLFLALDRYLFNRIDLPA